MDERLDDPRLARLRRVMESHPIRSAERGRGSIEAAVALVLRARDPLELLLIRRAESERDPWSGHVALPGGRRDRTDGDLLVTACRETEEETGVVLDPRAALIGGLDEIQPGTTLLPPVVITPFVMGVPPWTRASPSSPEVDATLWVPLPALRDTDAAGEIRIDSGGKRRALPSIHYGEYVIWGLTHRILVEFLARADEAGL